MKTILSHVGRAAALAALAATLSSAALAQRAAVDSEGALRESSADEAKAAASTKARPVGMLTGRASPQAVKQANGTVEQELDTSTMVYSVVKRNADGTLTNYCVTGSESAERLVKSKAPTSFAKSGKEQKYAVK